MYNIENNFKKVCWYMDIIPDRCFQSFVWFHRTSHLHNAVSLKVNDSHKEKRPKTFLFFDKYFNEYPGRRLNDGIPIHKKFVRLNKTSDPNTLCSKHIPIRIRTYIHSLYLIAFRYHTDYRLSKRDLYEAAH